MHALIQELLRRGNKVSVLVPQDGVDSLAQYKEKGVNFSIHPVFFNAELSKRHFVQSEANKNNT
jgi:hypothetical protein